MGTKLFVGNLSPTTTSKTVRACFHRVGLTTVRVDLVSDRGTGRSRGFAFVELETEEDAKEAIEKLHGTELKDQTLVVKEVDEELPDSARAGRGPGAGGRRGGGGSGSKGNVRGGGTKGFGGGPPRTGANRGR